MSVCAQSPSRLVLFADVSGSMRLYEERGDVVAVTCIETCLMRLSEITAAAGGRVVKTMGDEIMAVFEAPESGAQAALDMQLALEGSAGESRGMLPVRIGLHFGEVLERGGDVFGDTVNVAARLTAIACAGQIISSASTVARLPTYLQCGVRHLDSISIRGRNDPVEVVELVWRWDDGQTLVGGQFAKRMASAAASLHLRYGGSRIEMRHNSLVIGRDPSNDLVVLSPVASRRHAVIERRGDKFVIRDTSTNGTMIKYENSPPLMLRREELALYSCGIIAFQREVAVHAEDVIAFMIGETG